MRCGDGWVRVIGCFVVPSDCSLTFVRAPSLAVCFHDVLKVLDESAQPLCLLITAFILLFILTRTGEPSSRVVRYSSLIHTHTHIYVSRVRARKHIYMYIHTDYRFSCG